MEDVLSKALPGPAQVSPTLPVIPEARRRAAWGVAVAADLLQWALLPLFAEGSLSVVNGILDVGVAAALTALVGFHWSFLPAFVAEAVPLMDLVPTWTGSVWLATRDRR